MGRKPRLHYQGALYHVISRGNNRQTIFQSDKDRAVFLSLLRKLKKKCPFFLYAYCLMGNHFHLLVEVRDMPLSAIMQRLLTGYTRYFNWTHKRKGHLFQGRYKAFICQKDSCLLELMRYIHLNPVRAEIVEEPAKFPWSSHEDYIRDNNGSIVDTHLVLEYFDNGSFRGRKKYEAFIYDGIKMGRRKDMYPAENQPYVGKDEFIEEQAAKHAKIIDKINHGNSIKVPSLSEIIKIVVAQSGINEEVIRGASRKGNIAAARRSFAIEAYRKGNRPSEIAHFLNRSASFVSRLIETAF